MKTLVKTLGLILVVVMVSNLNAQTNSKRNGYWHTNATLISTKSDTLIMCLETYQWSTYNGNGWIYEHYKNYSPSELLFRSVQFQQGAITMSILGGISCGLFFGLSPFVSSPIGMYISGGIISGGFFIGALVMYGISNSLQKEAYLRMRKIQINANGFVVKF